MHCRCRKAQGVEAVGRLRPSSPPPTTTAGRLAPAELHQMPRIVQRAKLFHPECHRRPGRAGHCGAGVNTSRS